MTRYALLLLAAQSDVVEDLTPAKFDLACTGRDEQVIAGRTSTVSWKERFRIDLMADRFCRGKCEVVMPIREVDENAITLNQLTMTDPEVTNIEMVDRHTGFYVQRMIVGPSALTRGLSHKVQGTCKVVSFSGFPRQLF